MPDRIQISDLSIHLPNGLGPSAFNLTPPPPCPILLDITMNLHPTLIPLVASSDTMASLGVNYSSVSKTIYAQLIDAKRTFKKPEEVMEVAAGVALAIDCVESVIINLKLPRAVLHAQEVRYSATWTRGGTVKERICEIKDLRASAVVGLHPHERGEKQRLELDLHVRFKGGFGEWDHKAIQDIAVDFLEKSSAGTLELLIHILSAHLAPHLPPSIMDLTIRKPSALPFATPSISISRDTSCSPISIPQPTTPGPSRKRVFIALGSNIGDRVGNMRRAVDSLEGEGVEVVRTGRMYESEPMYVEDQARFINTVIEISTELEPLPLLKLLKRIEKSTGRTKTFTNGPRVVDLDLLFYGDEVVRIGEKGDEEVDGVGWLEVPHWGIAEREFVLRPLNDISPTLVHPALKLPISVLLARHPQSLVPIIPTTNPLPLKETPLIMAIFNATPDSFSDGTPSHVNTETALSSISSILSSPHAPDILDIGGMSTRPNSTPCSEEEESERVVPLIKAIRAEEKWSKVIISIDTYRPSVARAAIEAGADIINDVRGGREEGMLETMAKLGCPVVLMHSRGDSTTMTTPTSQTYSEGVVEGVRSELGTTIELAIKKGVRSWDIILDPGIGFAKSSEQSIDLLQRVGEISTLSTEGGGGWRYPMLVGASRKGFVGKITGREVAGERGWGDAVVNAFCTNSSSADDASGVGAGMEILRVHDWRGARESVKMAKALGGGPERS